MKTTHTSKLKLRCYGFASFLLFLGIFLSIIDTVVQEPPVTELDNSSISVRHTESAYIITVNRQLRINNGWPSFLTNELHNNDNDQVITLDHGDLRIGKSGKYQKSFVIPDAINGTWCVETDYTYSYRLSFRTHSDRFKRLCVNLLGG